MDGGGYEEIQVHSLKCVCGEGVNGGSGPTEEVVLGLARSVNSELGSAWTVGESGTAGPTGGHQPNRMPYPPSVRELISRGTVVLAVIGPGVEVSKVVTTGFGNDRSANMLEFARLALEYLLEQMEKEQ